MREFTEHILGTVWWALGIAALMAFALVGYNWWQSRVVYERDLRAMRAMLRIG